MGCGVGAPPDVVVSTHDANFTMDRVGEVRSSRFIIIALADPLRQASRDGPWGAASEEVEGKLLR